MDKTKNLIAVIVGLIIAVAGVILGVNNYVEKGNTTYAYCLLLAIIGLLILIVGIYNLVGKHDSRPVDAKVLAQAALCAISVQHLLKFRFLYREQKEQCSILAIHSAYLQHF